MKLTLLLPLMPFFLFACSDDSHKTVVVVSANAEWRSILAILKPSQTSIRRSPYGEWFVAPRGSITGLDKPVTLFHGGWGKVDAAASVQWAISVWKPALVVNLGTAGGFPGRVREGDVVFATRTLIYDIYERMGSASEALDDYTTELEPLPPALNGHVVTSTIISADQDIDPHGVSSLMRSYDAVAADWESASVARVCKKNGIRIIILRGVSDIVTPAGSRTYGNPQDFEIQSRAVMQRLLALLARVV